MTWTSTLLPCALSSLAAAGLTALYFRSRLSEARASANLFRMWWERDSEKMLVAQAELDLIRQQRIDAGRQSHKAEKARCAETTRALALSIGRPDLAERINDPLDDTGRGVAPVSTSAREGESPSAPFSLSCGGSAAPKADESGGTLPEVPTGRGAVPSRRRPSGSRPGIRPAKPAGETARLILPAEIPQTKGA
ncbi:hypothetical protein [Sphingopyxis sp. NJF-3]